MNNAKSLKRRWSFKQWSDRSIAYGWSCIEINSIEARYLWPWTDPLKTKTLTKMEVEPIRPSNQSWIVYNLTYVDWQCSNFAFNYYTKRSVFKFCLHNSEMVFNSGDWSTILLFIGFTHLKGINQDKTIVKIKMNAIFCTLIIWVSLHFVLTWA